MAKTVYLGGPISHFTFEEVSKWRTYATEQLSKDNITTLSPLRAKQYLNESGVLPTTFETTKPLSTNKGIVTRDRNDVMTCDVVLVNFLETSVVSIGTVAEIAWADAFRVPVVIAMEKGNVHDHGFIKELAGFIVPTLDEAIAVVKAILCP